MFDSDDLGSIWDDASLGLFTKSGISEILSRPAFSLEELLLENQFIEDTQARSEKLIEYLSKPENMRSLLYFISTPQSTESEEKSFRFPFMVCEALCCNVAPLIDTICDRNNTDLLKQLFSIVDKSLIAECKIPLNVDRSFEVPPDVTDNFLITQYHVDPQPGEIRPYLSAYFVKVVCLLCRVRPSAMVRFFDRTSTLAASLVKNVYDGSFPTLFESILSLPWDSSLGMGNLYLSRYDKSNGTPSLPSLFLSVFEDCISVLESKKDLPYLTMMKAANVSEIIITLLKKPRSLTPHSKFADPDYNQKSGESNSLLASALNQLNMELDPRFNSTEVSREDSVPLLFLKYFRDGEGAEKLVSLFYRTIQILSNYTSAGVVVPSSTSRFSESLINVVNSVFELCVVSHRQAEIFGGPLTFYSILKYLFAELSHVEQVLGEVAESALAIVSESLNSVKHYSRDSDVTKQASNISTETQGSLTPKKPYNDGAVLPFILEDDPTLLADPSTPPVQQNGVIVGAGNSVAVLPKIVDFTKGLGMRRRLPPPVILSVKQSRSRAKARQAAASTTKTKSADSISSEQQDEIKNTDGAEKLKVGKGRRRRPTTRAAGTDANSDAARSGRSKKKKQSPEDVPFRNRQAPILTSCAPIPSFSGTPRLGTALLALSNTLRLLLSVRGAEVEDYVIRSSIFSVLLLLVQAFPWHSLLHACVREAFLQLLIGPTQKISQRLVTALLFDFSLQNKIVECLRIALVPSTISAVGRRGVRTGNIGVFLSISNAILGLKSRSEKLDIYSYIPEHAGASKNSTLVSPPSENLGPKVIHLLASNSDWLQLVSKELAVLNVGAGRLVGGLAPDSRASGAVGANADAVGSRLTKDGDDADVRAGSDSSDDSDEEWDDSDLEDELYDFDENEETALMSPACAVGKQEDDSSSCTSSSSFDSGSFESDDPNGSFRSTGGISIESDECEDTSVAQSSAPQLRSSSSLTLGSKQLDRADRFAENDVDSTEDLNVIVRKISNSSALNEADMAALATLTENEVSRRSYTSSEDEDESFANEKTLNDHNQASSAFNNMEFSGFDSTLGGDVIASSTLPSSMEFSTNFDDISFDDVVTNSAPSHFPQDVEFDSFGSFGDDPFKQVETSVEFSKPVSQDSSNPTASSDDFSFSADFDSFGTSTKLEDTDGNDKNFGSDSINQFHAINTSNAHGSSSTFSVDVSSDQIPAEGDQDDEFFSHDSKSMHEVVQDDGVDSERDSTSLKSDTDEEASADAVQFESFEPSAGIESNFSEFDDFVVSDKQKDETFMDNADFSFNPSSDEFTFSDVGTSSLVEADSSDFSFADSGPVTISKDQVDFVDVDFTSVVPGSIADQVEIDEFSYSSEKKISQQCSNIDPAFEESG